MENITKGVIMKKVILFSILSVLLYSATGYAGKEDAAAQVPSAPPEEEAAETRWNKMQARWKEAEDPAASEAAAKARLAAVRVWGAPQAEWDKLRARMNEVKAAANKPDEAEADTAD